MITCDRNSFESDFDLIREASAIKKKKRKEKIIKRQKFQHGPWVSLCGALLDGLGDKVEQTMARCGCGLTLKLLRTEQKISSAVECHLTGQTSTRRQSFLIPESQLTGNCSQKLKPGLNSQCRHQILKKRGHTCSAVKKKKLFRRRQWRAVSNGKVSISVQDFPRAVTISLKQKTNTQTSPS